MAARRAEVAGDLDAPVSRREFEAAVAGLASSIREVKDELGKRSPGLSNMLTLVGMAVAVIVTSVQNFSRVGALDAWRDAHERVSEARAVSVEATLDDIRSRTRAVEKGLEEQEMQHRWMADVENLQVQRLEQLVKSLHPEAPLPSDYWPLGEIGRAISAGGGQ